jgi:hypothetical protein
MRDERLSVSHSWVLRRVFLRMGAEITEGYCTMRWALYVTRMRKDEKAYMISVGKPEGKRLLEGPRNRRDNIKTEHCALLGYYAASSGKLFPRLQNNLSLPRLSCSETSARNYHYSLSNNPEERSSHLLGSRTMKIRILKLITK